MTPEEARRNREWAEEQATQAGPMTPELVAALRSVLRPWPVPPAKTETTKETGVGL